MEDLSIDEMYDMIDDSWEEVEYEEIDDDDDANRMSKRVKQDKNRVIINSDFNLNSPIMPDVLNNIVNLVNNGISPIHHLNRTMLAYNEIKNILPKNIKLGDINETYRAMRTFLLSDVKSNDYKEFLNTWITEIDSVKEIPDKFLKSILSKPLAFDLNSIFDKHDALSILLDKFLEINLIIEVMSNRNRLTVKNYSDKYEFERLIGGSYRIKTYNWVGLLTDSIFIDTKNKVLYDYNMMLMIKDILIGRLNTLLLIALNLEGRYSESCMKDLIRLFVIGDKFLLKKGNAGFDSISVLEPICIEQMSSIANKTRPRIIQPDNYTNYIQSKVETDDIISNRFVQNVRDIVYSKSNIYDITAFYGSFRLWGHPFIEYEIGLGKLKEQVRMEKPNIDKKYCSLLANDLMRDMLINFYKKNKKWNVIDNEHNRSIPGTEELLNNSWISLKSKKLLEGHWHELDIERILEVPEDISDSDLFADKTHSKNLKEVKKIASRDKRNPIPTERLLRTYLKEDRIDISKFINEIDANGFTADDLLIGLKAKERELKRFGRFFTLMTWKLRVYFVISEHLIKKDIIPFYKGLTMADGFIEVMEKMLDRTSGQRGSDYSKITYANHIDYTKWNNHQRDEAVGPVFSVLDKMYGLTNFFRLSHEIFKKCVVYYPERPEFFGKDSQFYWEGQPGGFEGIRQKGWSLVGILCLLREAKKRNTEVDILAQGDNQVVFCKYKVPSDINDSDLDNELKKIYQNNEYLMSSILKAADKIGLIINQDETVQSANFTVYGKIPVYKGNILNLETKMANRLSGITNDQLPTSANIMSSVNSMALSICQRDSSVRCAVYYQAIFGIFILNIIKKWNAVSCQGMTNQILNMDPLIRWLYHDKCLGGNTGMALTRFLIRRFPDPITETLVFYKKMHDTTSVSSIKKIMNFMGNPTQRPLNRASINKLAEDPTCLNIVKSGDISILIRSQVKKSLINHLPNIKNKLLHNALKNSKKQEFYILTFLQGVTPCFPRFISDFKQSSACGYIDGIVGLVENSKTIRSMFSQEFEGKIIDLSISWEREQMLRSVNDCNNVGKQWDCSSTHADHLRLLSWGTHVVGATIPHPYEYHDHFVSDVRSAVENNKDLMTCLISPKINLDINFHGPNKPYLGSNTKESSGAYQSWEKELTNPLFKGAAQLRKNINWTVERGSNLSKSIMNNLNYVTGLDMGETESGNKKLRTGTAQHRYRSSRQDSGGFCNISPNVLSWFTVTSDNMNDLSDRNYDFMFQASLIYAETLGAHIVKEVNSVSSFGLSISCKKCIRPLSDLKLNSKMIYAPHTISKKFWLNSIIKSEIVIKEDVYSELFPYIDQCPMNGSFSIGLHQSIASLARSYNLSDDFHMSDVLSMGVMMKLDPHQWFKGLKVGIALISGYTLLQHPSFINEGRVYEKYYNRYKSMINMLVSDQDLCARLRLSNIDEYMTYKTSQMSVNYPAKNSDLSEKMSIILTESLINSHNTLMNVKSYILRDPIIYNDYNNDIIKKVIVIGAEVVSNLKDNCENYSRQKLFNLLKQCLIGNVDLRSFNNISNKMFLSTSELKTHAENLDKFKREYPREVYNDSRIAEKPKFMKLNLTNVQNSKKHKGNETHMLQSLKPLRFATSAHYKLNDILNNLKLNPRFALVGGDGSGGMSSLLLRKYENIELVFNTLLEVGSETLKGGNPGAPQAISSLPVKYKTRCVNLDYSWTEPSDLSTDQCWRCLSSYTTRMKFDLMIIDAQAREENEFLDIYKKMIQNKRKIMDDKGVCIIKCYTGIAKNVFDILYKETSDNIYGIQSVFSRDFTTEFYLIITEKNINISNCDMVESIDAFNLSKRTVNEELKRAKYVKDLKLYRKVPQSLSEKYIFKFANLMKGLNLNFTMSKVVSSLLINDDYKKGFKIIAEKCLFDNLSENEIPSDQALSKLIAVLSGILCFVGIDEDDNFPIYMSNSLNVNPINVCISTEERYIYLSFDKKHFKNIISKRIYPIYTSTIGATVTRCLIGMNNMDLELLKYDNNINFDYNESDFFD
ncbi:RNA-dependent RNA polymerase [Almendravirus cootbay]|uniref:RNA-dependent RNA polymerase n=1 Tax=Almendravirus cootbay TaxID=1972685 RepID=UPI001E281AD7|nr:RNA-dependent RNA polymerase [Almendravirus cootbay]